jgi:DNA-binding transcriptional MerR regulator
MPRSAAQRSAAYSLVLHYASLYAKKEGSERYVPPDKLFYRIKEVALIFNEEPYTLRYWEKEFSNLLSTRKRQSGVTRQYTKADILNFGIIHRLLRIKKLTCEGAHAHLNEKKDEEESRAKAIEKLIDIKQQLLEMQEALQAPR